MNAAKESAPARGAAWGEMAKPQGLQSDHVGLIHHDASGSAWPLQSRDPLVSAIRGGRAAEDVVHLIQRGCSSPDALLAALQGALAVGDPEHIRAFARRVQKAIERPEVGGTTTSTAHALTAVQQDDGLAPRQGGGC